MARSGSRTTRDGVDAALRAAGARPSSRSRGTVVLVQGRAEFIEKLQRDRRRTAPPRLPCARPSTGAARAARSASSRASARAMSAACATTSATSRSPWRRCCAEAAAALFRAGPFDGRRALPRRRPRRLALPVSRLVALGADARPDHDRAPVRASRLASLLFWLGFGRAFVPGGGDTAIATKPFEGNRLTSDPVRYARNSALLGSRAPAQHRRPDDRLGPRRLPADGAASTPRTAAREVTRADAGRRRRARPVGLDAGDRALRGAPARPAQALILPTAPARDPDGDRRDPGAVLGGLRRLHPRRGEPDRRAALTSAGEQRRARPHAAPVAGRRRCAPPSAALPPSHVVTTPPAPSMIGISATMS